MSSLIESFLIGLGTGFVGSAHCIFMCGGIACTVALQSTSASFGQRVLSPVLYSLGRTSTYILLGLLFSFIGAKAGDWFSIQHILFALANVLLIFCGVYLFLMDRSFRWLEFAGSKFWARLSPIATRLMALQTLSGRFFCGLVWGLLPCSLVYMMMAKSFLAQNQLDAAIMMAGFGLGTTPVMLAIGWSGQVLSFTAHKRLLYWIGGLFLIGFGVFGLYKQGMKVIVAA